jgi:transketolase
LQEGNIWEAVMTAAKYKLGNYVAIVDRNHLQIDGPTDEVCPVGDVAAKFRAFDWEVMEMNGHDFDDIEKTITKGNWSEEKARLHRGRNGKGKRSEFYGKPSGMAWDCTE